MTEALVLPGLLRRRDPVDRALAGFKHVYDARKGSAFTDYGTGGATGTPTNVTHSGKWWTFVGASSPRADVYPPSGVPMGASDAATVVIVMRRTSPSVPAATEVVMSSKDDPANAGRGWRLVVSTGGAFLLAVGDGTNSITKTSTGISVEDSTLFVVTIEVASDVIRLTANGITYGTTSRGTVADATAAVVAATRIGMNASAATNPLNGDIGLVAVATRAITDNQRTSLVSVAQGAWA